MLIYHNDWNLLEERDINDNLLASYVHGEKIDEIICRIIPGNTIYYHHDALGNVTLLTDDSGNLLEQYVYDPFGKPTILNATNGILQTSAYGNRFLFTGREYLPRLDFYDYRNRVYSAELGRFLTTDPIKFKAGDINIYRYVGNNPINWTDPMGESFGALVTLVGFTLAPIIITTTLCTLDPYIKTDESVEYDGNGCCIYKRCEYQRICSGKNAYTLVTCDESCPFQP